MSLSTSSCATSVLSAGHGHTLTRIGDRAALASLSTMLERRLVIVSGKGGVGKSAISVALALRAQRAGKRVLISAMIDQVGAALHLGADRLGYRPATFHGGIEAMAIDRA